MADSQHGKVVKLHESRTEAESDLKRIHQQIVEAVENGDRRVRVERLVKNCDDAITKAIDKNDQLRSLATKADNSALLIKELEDWLHTVTTSNDGILKKARNYIDSLPAPDNKFAIVIQNNKENCVQPNG